MKINAELDFSKGGFLSIKNYDTSTFEILNLNEAKHIKLKKSKKGKSLSDEFNNSTKSLIIFGILTIWVYGLGLPFIIYGLYKHMKLDLSENAFLEVSWINNDKERTKINLEHVPEEDIEYLFGLISDYFALNN